MLSLESFLHEKKNEFNLNIINFLLFSMTMKIDHVFDVFLRRTSIQKGFDFASLRV